jgi:hypothetical protein
VQVAFKPRYEMELMGEVCFFKAECVGIADTGVEHVNVLPFRTHVVLGDS